MAFTCTSLTVNDRERLTHPLFFVYLGGDACSDLLAAFYFNGVLSFCSAVCPIHEGATIPGVDWPVLRPPTQRGPQLGPDWPRGAGPGAGSLNRPSPLRSLRSRGCGRGSWTSSSLCSGAPRPRPSASCRTPWASWMTPYTCAAPAPQVGLPSQVLRPPPSLPCLAGRSHPALGKPDPAPPFPAVPPESTPHPFLPLVLADYLVSRAQAALDAVSALEKGHAQYLTSRSGEWGVGTGPGQTEVAGGWVLAPLAVTFSCLEGGFPQQVCFPVPTWVPDLGSSPARLRSSFMTLA